MPYDPIEEYDFDQLFPKDQTHLAANDDDDDEFDEFATMDFNDDAFLQEIAKAEEGALAGHNRFSSTSGTRRTNGITSLHEQPFQLRQQLPVVGTSSSSSSSSRGTNVYNGRGRGRATANASGRQTTLFESFGGSQSQGGNLSVTGGGLRMVHEPGGTEGPPVRPDARCAHRFDQDAVRSWTYPMNYPVRDYQFTIVKAALFNNTLVSIPTGLGKTLIAAVVMYNFHRWFPSGKVVFMAPTKPLVAQQIKACHKICGISQNDTVELTGAQNPESRRTAWLTKRVFFLTPQVMKNDLQRGTCPASDVVCVVVDEAHRATGNHANCEVVRELSSRNAQFRILALTATPGTTVDSIQVVIDNLLISKIESRTEDSPDIIPYTHQTVREPIVVPLGPVLTRLSKMFAKVMSVYATRLHHQGVLYDPDPFKLSRFMVMKGREAFRLSAQNRGITQGQKAAVECDAAILTSLCQAFTLLLHHGLRPFQCSLSQFIHGNTNTKGVSRSRKELLNNPDVHMVLNTAASLIADPEFSGHPKLDRLVGIVLDHFSQADPTDNLDAAIEGNAEAPQTRVMIFSQYRESVEDIVNVLNKHDPIIRAMTFLGQATGRSGKGLSQKEQLAVISKFQAGNYNVLVSTSIGEEGLDIGDVDLIVCYDSQSSPIRMLQRMGRTGRKRQGRVAFLLTEGKEQQAWKRSQESYKTLQKALLDSSKIKLCDDSPTVLPAEAKPGCIKKVLEIAEYEIVEKVRKSRSATTKRTSAAAIPDDDDGSPAHFLSAENLDELVRKYTAPSRRRGSGVSKTASRGKRKQPAKRRTLAVPQSDDEDGNDFDIDGFLESTRPDPAIDAEPDDEGSDESDESDVGPAHDSLNAVNRKLKRPIAGIGFGEEGDEVDTGRTEFDPFSAMAADDDGLLSVNDIEAALMGGPRIPKTKVSKKRKETSRRRDVPKPKKKKTTSVPTMERRTEDWPDESDFVRIRESSPGYDAEMGELDDTGMFQFRSEIQDEREILSVIDEVEFEEFPAFEADIDSAGIDLDNVTDLETVACDKNGLGSTVSLDFCLPDRHDRLIAKEISDCSSIDILRREPDELQPTSNSKVPEPAPCLQLTGGSSPSLITHATSHRFTENSPKSPTSSPPTRFSFGSRLRPVPPPLPTSLVMGNVGEVGPDDSILRCHDRILKKLANARTHLTMNRKRDEECRPVGNNVDGTKVPEHSEEKNQRKRVNNDADLLTTRSPDFGIAEFKSTGPVHHDATKIKSTLSATVPSEPAKSPSKVNDHCDLDDGNEFTTVWDEPEMSPEDGSMFEFDMSFDAPQEGEETDRVEKPGQEKEIGAPPDSVNDLLNGIQFEDDDDVLEWDLDAIEEEGDDENGQRMAETTGASGDGRVLETEFGRSGDGNRTGANIENGDGVLSVMDKSGSEVQIQRVGENSFGNMNTEPVFSAHTTKVRAGQGTVPVRTENFRFASPAQNSPLPVACTSAGTSYRVSQKTQEVSMESPMLTQMPRRGRHRLPMKTINLVSPFSNVGSAFNASVADPPLQRPRNRLRKGKGTADDSINSIERHVDDHGGPSAAARGSNLTMRITRLECSSPDIPRRERLKATTRSKRDMRRAQPNPFLELEAQVSDDAGEFSGDELDQNVDENLSGFIDDGTQPSASVSSADLLPSSSPGLNMHAFYRQSLLSPADANRAFKQSANGFGGARFKMKFGVGTPPTGNDGSYGEEDEEDDDGFVVDDDASLTVDDDSQESLPDTTTSRRRYRTVTGTSRTNEEDDEDQVVVAFEKIATTPSPVRSRTAFRTRNRLLQSSSPISTPDPRTSRPRIDSMASPLTIPRPPEMDGVFKKPTPKSSKR